LKQTNVRPESLAPVTAWSPGLFYSGRGEKHGGTAKRLKARTNRFLFEIRHQTG